MSWGTATGLELLERPSVETPHPNVSSSLRAQQDWLMSPITQNAVPRTEKFGADNASSDSMKSNVISAPGRGVSIAAH